MQQRPIGLILVFILLVLAGQYLFKAGMTRPESQENIQVIAGHLAAVARGEAVALGAAAVATVLLFLKPLILGGMVCYGLSTACWLAVLSKTDLSFAYPMLSLSYIAILLMGWFSFNEHITAMRWVGVLLICVGIVGIYSEDTFLRGGYGFAALLVTIAGALALAPAVPQSPAPAIHKPLGLILFSICLGLVGQFLFKSGMNKPAYKEQISAIGARLRELKRGVMAAAVPAATLVVTLFLRPYVVSGLVCYVLGTVCWLAILTRTPLSFAYPLLSIGYVAILLMGWLLFKERVTAIRWFGVVLICFGILTIYSEELVRAHGLLFGAGLVSMAVFLSAASRAARSVASPA